MSIPPRRALALAGAFTMSCLLASAPSRADEPPEPGAPPEAHPAPALHVVDAEPELHFSVLDEGDTADDPDDEFRVAADGSQIHRDTVTVDFEGPSRDAQDARVEIVELVFPDAADATMAWVLTNTANGARRIIVASEEEGWFAWSDGTATDVYARAEDGSVVVNGEPFAAFKERPAGPLYRDASPALLAAWVGLTHDIDALDRADPSGVYGAVAASADQAVADAIANLTATSGTLDTDARLREAAMASAAQAVDVAVAATKALVATSNRVASSLSDAMQSTASRLLSCFPR